MPDDRMFEATDEGRIPGPDVPAGVRQGGTQPGHDAAAEPDHSPHDAGKGGTPDGKRANDASRGVAGLDRGAAAHEAAAEEDGRGQSIGAEDRADGQR